MTHIAETCTCGASFEIESRHDANVQWRFNQWKEKHRNCFPKRPQVAR